VLLYDVLMHHTPGPVVELNRAVAVAMAQGPEAGLHLLAAERIAGPLDAFHLYHAARADLHRRAGHREEARAAYGRALGLVTNGAERAYLERRLRELPRPLVEPVDDP
jgi:RNA polymerase sigma-70 factor, ECF subfamily